MSARRGLFVLGVTSAKEVQLKEALINNAGCAVRTDRKRGAWNAPRVEFIRASLRFAKEVVMGRPVVHWELMSKDPAKVADFYVGAARLDAVGGCVTGNGAIMAS